MKKAVRISLVLFMVSCVLFGACSKSKSPTAPLEDTYTISGTVTGADSVTVTLSGDASDSWMVKKSGESYAFTVAKGGTYTVTPSKSGYVFTPSYKTIKNLSANLTQNFVAKLASYTLSGTVTGADGVTVTLSGDASASLTLKKSGESYSFTVDAFGTYTITPTKKGYVFTPPNTKVENLVANHVQNFDANAIPLFTLSGTITGADGVTVTLSGDDTGSQTVNNGGSYAFIVAYGGNYTVTPSNVLYTFTPMDKMFMNVSSSGMQDFTAEFNYASPGMKPIPAGTFSMGQNDISYAVPVHTVSLWAFSMSMYEVTQGQYKAIMGKNPSNYQPVNIGGLYPPMTDYNPVERVTWFDAIKYCNALSIKAGFQPCYNENMGDCDFSKSGFRLPTEAEWEYACRAGSTTDYDLGVMEKVMGWSAWYNANSSSKTHPVGKKDPNAWGLYDMRGNVREWCNDWYGLYTSDSQSNPTGPSTGSYRVYRGGCWNDNADYCRLAVRYGFDPSDRGGMVILGYVGFRVVRRP